MLTPPPPISATLRRERSKPLQFSSCDSGTAALSSLSHVSSIFFFNLFWPFAVFSLYGSARAEAGVSPRLCSKGRGTVAGDPAGCSGDTSVLFWKLQSRLTTFSPDPCLLKNYLPLVSDFSSGCINFLSSRPTGERLGFIKGVTPMFYSCLYLMLGRRAWLVPLHPPPPPTQAAPPEPRRSRGTLN